MGTIRPKTIRARELRRSMTEGEAALWALLRYDQLGVRFRRQHPFAGFILDFFCTGLKLAIEVDGEAHEDRAEVDRSRDDILRRYGIATIRVRNDDVLGAPDEVRARIAEAIAARERS